MSEPSSKPAGWWSALEPASEILFRGRGDGDDPRLGEVIRRWKGEPWRPRPGQPVLLGFPYDEGVRRNHGRPGAALAPTAVREFLYRLTPWDAPARVDLAALEIADLGNLWTEADVALAQQQLGAVVAELLAAGAVPVILGGGHETAFGHYLGYAGAGLECGIINVDAHLDVRSYPRGPHSGSPFRQAMEHPTHPLRPGRYAVLGAQRQGVARAHEEYVAGRKDRIHWLESDGDPGRIAALFGEEVGRLGREAGAVLVSVDADVFRQGDVPGSSAPSPIGLDGRVFPEIAFRAGADARVRSLDLVEINPHFDLDGQTARWAAVGVRQFLVGLATRAVSDASQKREDESASAKRR